MSRVIRIYPPRPDEEVKELQHWRDTLPDVVKALMGWPRCRDCERWASLKCVQLWPIHEEGWQRLIPTPFGKVEAHLWCESCLKEKRVVSDIRDVTSIPRVDP